MWRSQRRAHRPMVPEGVLSPIRGGFRLYIQSNFADWPNVSFRQRFTIAHELVHTFYYDLNGGVPRQKRTRPRDRYLSVFATAGPAKFWCRKFSCEGRLIFEVQWHRPRIS